MKKNDIVRYQTEYLVIHNQRMAFVQTIHLWHQIGLPAALLIFGFLINQAKMNNGDIFPIVMAAGFASVVVIFVRLYSNHIDTSVVRLYPRIITLELILGYKFYRNYLKDKGPKEKGVIRACEKFASFVPNRIEKKVEKEFKDKKKVFSPWRRGHRILDLAAIVMILCFVLVTIYQVNKP